MAFFLGAQNQMVGILNEGSSVLTGLCTRSSSYAKTRIKSRKNEKVSSLPFSTSTRRDSNKLLLKNKFDISVLPKDWKKIISVPSIVWVPRRQQSKWTISHKSTDTFFENKYGVHERKILQPTFGKLLNLCKATIPKRWQSYRSSEDRIMELEETANKNLFDASAQAMYYKAVLHRDPEYVIRRYESGKFATNADVDEIYMKALLLTEKLSPEEALKKYSNSNSSSYFKNSFQRSSMNTSGNYGAPENPMYVVTNKKFNFFDGALKVIISAVFIAVIISFARSQSNLLNMNTKQIQPDRSEKNVKFSDVEGCDEAKEELKEVVEFLKAPERFESLGAKLPGGLLLVGPPGTGKTLLAKAIAGEADVPFFFASGAEFDEMFVGVGAGRMRKLFESAKRLAPCIIFIDELDAVGGARVAHDSQPYSRMTLNQLLIELDGFDKNPGVVVIGATNFPEVLDKALTRPGRFDSRVHVPLPDVRGREKILQLYLKKSKCADDVDAMVLARGTIGFSGADLCNLVNQAALRAAALSESVVTHKHFEWAKEKMVMGPENKSRVVSEHDRKITAYHESGHAIVSLFTSGTQDVHKVTIVPRGNALGYVMQLPEKDQLSMSKQQLLAQMDVCMGGRVAEELIFGADSVTTGASSDMQKATEIARNMVTKFGMSEKVGTILIDKKESISAELSTLIDSEVKRLLSESYERAKRLLKSRSKEHQRLAEGLLKYETFDAKEVQLVITGKLI